MRADLGASVVVLAKDSRLAKTRLGVPRMEARRLAIRLAGSTIRAALDAETVAAVHVVTGDADVAREALRWGAHVVAEPRPLGMNRAAALGRRHALAMRPASPVVIMVADLPVLHSGDIDAVVREHHLTGFPLHVTDHVGTGTTLLVHGPGELPGIGFGRGSAATHRRLGYLLATSSTAALRHDLDTPEDLAGLGMLTELARRTRVRTPVGATTEDR